MSVTLIPDFSQQWEEIEVAWICPQYSSGGHRLSEAHFHSLWSKFWKQPMRVFFLLTKIFFLHFYCNLSLFLLFSCWSYLNFPGFVSWCHLSIWKIPSHYFSIYYFLIPSISVSSLAPPSPLFPSSRCLTKYGDSFFWKDLLFILYVYECFTCMYVSVPHVACCPGWHKRMLDPLKLEVWMTVNHHMDAGDWTQILRESYNSIPERNRFHSDIFMQTYQCFSL